MSEVSAGAPLACPRCGARHAAEERFCSDCGMPLVTTEEAGPSSPDEAQERARKVKPQYLGGELVKVAWARNLAEAELIQGMLLEEGIPSVERRARGFDVPDFLAGGPRDILVPQAADRAARDLLADVQGDAPVAAPGSGLAERPATFFVKFAAAIAAALALVWVLYQLAT